MHLAQLRHQNASLEAHQIDVKVVTFDSLERAQSYQRKTNLDWPLLIDSKLTLYRAYGMERGSWWDIYSPGSILRYLKLIFSGTLPGRPGNDWRQLGGDVLIDPAGIVHIHHVSQTPHDRPDVKTILNCVARLDQ